MKSETKFPGFKREYTEQFFKYPNELAEYWHQLSGSQQKVLDYIIRRTFGFHKLKDSISLSQFTRGTRGVDKGSGVSQSQVQRALKSLEEKGFIKTKKEKYRTTLITLALKDGEEGVINPKDVSLDVRFLIGRFDQLSPHQVDTFLEDKREVKAIESLISFYGQDGVEALISLADEVKGEEYAPVIESPRELCEKLEKLKTFIYRHQQHLVEKIPPMVKKNT